MNRYNRVSTAYWRAQRGVGSLPTLCTSPLTERILALFTRLLARPRVLQRLRIPDHVPSLDALADIVLSRVTPPAELPVLLATTAVNQRVDLMLYALCSATYSWGRQRTLTEVAFELLDRALPGDLAISRLRWMVFCAGARGQEVRNGRSMWDALYFRLMAALNGRGEEERAQLLYLLFNCPVKTARYMGIFLTFFFDLWYMVPLFAGRELLAAYRYGRVIHAVFCVSHFLQDITLYRHLHKNKYLKWILSHVGHEFQRTGRLGRLRSDVWHGSRLLAQMETFCQQYAHMWNANLLLAAGQRSLEKVVAVTLKTAPLMQVLLAVFTNLFLQRYTNWRRLTALLRHVQNDGRVMYALLTVTTHWPQRRPALSRQLLCRWMGQCLNRTVLLRVFLYIGRTSDAALFRRFVAKDFLTVGAFPLTKCSWDKFLVLLIRHITGRNQTRARRARLMLADSITAGMSTLPNARPVPLCLTKAVHVNGLSLLQLLFHCGFFSPNHLVRLAATDHDLLPRLMERQPADPFLADKLTWLMFSAEQPRSLARLCVLFMSRQMGCGPQRKSRVLQLQEFMNNNYQVPQQVDNAVRQLFFQEELAEAGF